jgi:hypothetical protein
MSQEKVFLSEDVKKRWAPVIDSPDAPVIKESWKKRVTTILLENTARSSLKPDSLTKRSHKRVGRRIPAAAKPQGIRPNLDFAHPSCDAEPHRI